jgi:hypothetical protein
MAFICDDYDAQSHASNGRGLTPAQFLRPLNGKVRGRHAHSNFSMAVSKAHGLALKMRALEQFSSEVDAGSREENAIKQESRAPIRFNRIGTGSSATKMPSCKNISAYG